MTKTAFWKIIDSARAASGGSHDEMYRDTLEHLAKLDAREIIAWKQIFTQYLFEAYRWDLRGAAYVIGGGCGDDGFHDFRSWLISMGHRAYESALVDPDSLGDLADLSDDIFFEEFGYVASRAYELKTGRLLWKDVADAGGPSKAKFAHPKKAVGTRWNDADLPTLYPSLSKRFGAN